MDPNIISLRIGFPRLSGVGGWLCRRKCRESRRGRGGLEYVAENEVRYEQEEARVFKRRGSRLAGPTEGTPQPLPHDKERSWVAENEVRYEQEEAWDIKKRCFCRCRPSEGTPNP